MFQLLKSLNETMGVVIISHDINVALNYATKVVHVNKTLYIHDVPKTQSFTLFQNQPHVCDVELISATRCHHIHPETHS